MINFGGDPDALNTTMSDTEEPVSADTLETPPQEEEETEGRIWIQGPRYDPGEKKSNPWWCELLDIARESTFSDTIITVDDTEYKCQKLFLSAVSPFFRTMYTCGLQESKDGKVKLGEVTTDVFERILEFLHDDFYLEVDSMDDLLELLSGASFLRILPLLDALYDTIERIFDCCAHLEYVAGVWKLARLHGQEKLEKYCLKIIWTNFSSVDYAAYLDLEEIKTIICDSNIQLDTCKEPTNIIVQWVAEDADGREKHLQELANCLRLEDAEAFINEEKYIFRPHRYRGTFLEDAVEIKDTKPRQIGTGEDTKIRGYENVDSESDKNVKEGEGIKDSNINNCNNMKGPQPSTSTAEANSSNSDESDIEENSLTDHVNLDQKEETGEELVTELTDDEKAAKEAEQKKLDYDNLVKGIENQLKEIVTEMKCNGVGCYDSFMTRNVELNVVLQDNYPIIPCLYHGGVGEQGLYGLQVPENDMLIRKGFAACVRGTSELYITGGQAKGRARSNYLHKFDNETGAWKTCAGMVQGRKNHVMFAYGDSVFVFGGSLSENCLDFEEYNITDDKWVTQEDNKTDSYDLQEGKVTIKACTFEEFAMIFLLDKESLSYEKKMKHVEIHLFSYETKQFQLYNSSHLLTSRAFLCPKSVLTTHDGYVYSVMDNLKVYRWKYVPNDEGFSYPEIIAHVHHGGYAHDCTKFGVEVEKRRLVIFGGHFGDLATQFSPCSSDDISVVDLETGEVMCKRFSFLREQEESNGYKMAVKMEGSYWFKMMIQRKWLGKKFVFENRDESDNDND